MDPASCAPLLPLVINWEVLRCGDLAMLSTSAGLPLPRGAAGTAPRRSEAWDERLAGVRDEEHPGRAGALRWSEGTAAPAVRAGADQVPQSHAGALLPRCWCCCVPRSAAGPGRLCRRREGARGVTSCWPAVLQV